MLNRPTVFHWIVSIYFVLTDKPHPWFVRKSWAKKVQLTLQCVNLLLIFFSHSMGECWKSRTSSCEAPNYSLISHHKVEWFLCNPRLNSWTILVNNSLVYLLHLRHSGWWWTCWTSSWGPGLRSSQVTVLCSWTSIMCILILC